MKTITILDVTLIVNKIVGWMIDEEAYENFLVYTLSDTFQFHLDETELQMILDLLREKLRATN